MKKPVIFSSAFLFLFGFLAVIGCKQRVEKPTDPIKVGIVLPVTGKYAKFGEIEKLSFEMAEEEINAAGGVNGRPLEFLIEDTTSKPDVGRSAAEKLISQDRVVMLGGGYSSSVTAAVAGVAINKSFPFLVNTGSADTITEPTAHTPSGKKAAKLKKELKKEEDEAKAGEIKAQIKELEARADKEVERIFRRFRIFRLNSPVSEYASGLEGFLADVVKPKTVAILHENSLFGTKGAEAYAAAYVIADVLGRAKSHSKEDITKALSETDMMTVFGPVKFVSYDRKINQNKLETYVVQWLDGKLKMIWPRSLSKADYVYPVDWLKERR